MQILILDSQAAFYAERLKACAPGVTFLAATSHEQALEIGQEAEVLIGLAPYLKPELLQAMPNLKWIQALTTGVDNLMGQTGVALTSCHGIHGPQMSEMAVLMMLSSARRFDQVIDNQRRAEWQRWPQPLLANKTACLVGVGAISEHLAGLLAAFSMRVTGISGRTNAPHFDQLFAKNEIGTAFAEADYVVVLTPYTPQYHHIIDAKALASMKPDAHLINLSRGGCVDEDAMIAALRTGAIAGAACDVFASEPLPKDSPLWTLPNMTVTPHIGGFADVYHEQALPIVAANLADYANGGVSALKGRLDK